MPDETQPPAEGQQSPLETGQVEGATNSLGDMGAKLEGVGTKAKSLIETLMKMGASSAVIQTVISSLSNMSDTAENAQNSLVDFGEMFKGFDADSIGVGTISAAISTVKDSIESAGQHVRDVFGGTLPAAIGAADIAMAGLGKTGVNALNNLSAKVLGVGILDIEKDLKASDAAALKAGQAFGRTFDGAAQSTEMFRSTLADSIRTTRASSQEILQVRDALGEAFDTTEMVGNLGNLSQASAGVQSAMNLTNVALLTAAATGMEASQMANIMGKAHLELGESVETAGEAIAAIADAAEGSGLRFNEVSQAIMGSAGALKMWGGTIASVTPVFKSFVASLGEGRKGLATDLMNQYVGGLQKMGLSTRALLGTIGGMGGGGAGGGTAIGAGLEMEAALETGEGMEQVSANLIQALNQFGGGQGVITREEARADPTLERNFIVQRQLLQQMLGVDQASANQMMGILKDVESGGMAVGGDTKEKLGDLMKSGESTKNATVSAIDNASRDQERAVMSSGKLVIGAIRDLSRGLGITEAVETMNNTLATLGAGEKEDMTPEQRENFRNQVAQGGAPGGVQRRREQQMLQDAGAKGQVPNLDSVLANLERNLAAKEMRQTAVQATPEEGRNLMVAANNRLAQQMSRWQEKGRDSSSPGAMAAVQRTLRPLRDRLNQLGRMGKRQGGPTEAQEKEKASLQQFINAAERAATGRTIDEVSAKEMRTGRLERRPQDRQEQRRGRRQLQQFQQRTESSTREQRRRPQQQREQLNRLMGTGRRPQAPVRETAERAGGIRRQQEQVKLRFQSEPVEQEIKLRVIADKESVSISVDDEHIKKVIREVEAGGAEN